MNSIKLHSCFNKPGFRILFTILLLFHSAYLFADPAEDQLIAAQKAIIAQKIVDSTAFYTFANECLQSHEGNILMNTYRQVVETGQKDVVIADLPFLLTLDKKTDTNKLNENSFYAAYYIAVINNKYHLDSLVPLFYYQRSVFLAEKLKDVCLLAKGYFGMGAYYMNIKHDLLKANQYDQLLNDILTKAGKLSIIDCDVDGNTGFIVLNCYLEDYPKAIEYVNKSLADYKQVRKPQHIFDMYCRRSFLEAGVGNYDKAFITLDSARMAVQNEPNKERLYNFLAADSFNIYIELNNYDKALPLSKKIVVNQLNGSNDEYYDYLLNLVKMDTHFGRFDEAQQYINLYTATLKDWNIQRWKNAYEMKYTLSKAENNTGDALKYYEAYTKYNNLVHHQRQNFAVIAQQIKYNTRQKEEALQLQIAANKAEKQRANFIIAAVVALCLLLLLLLVYRINKGLREKDKLNKVFALQLIQHTEKEQLRLANELHDGLGQELLLLKNSLIHDKDNAKAGAVGNIIETVRGMARELHPPLLEVVGLKSAIESQLQKIDEQESIFISSEIEFAGDLDNHTKLQVYRIFQEAITNVLKYAKATSVLVTLKEDKGLVTLTIKDNGIGFDLDERRGNLAGFGLQSMKQRADSINGILKINTLTNKGTEITLTFKHENISS